MSITVRLWDSKTLEAIKNRTADNHTLTVFMNAGTFYEHEIIVYPYDIRKVYRVTFGRWYEGEYCPPVTFYATDDEAALWFVSQEYHTDAVKTVSQVIYNEDGQIEKFRKVKIEWQEA